MGVSKNQGPHYAPRIVGLLQSRPQNGPPIHTPIGPWAWSTPCSPFLAMTLTEKELPRNLHAIGSSCSGPLLSIFGCVQLPRRPWRSRRGAAWRGWCRRRLRLVLYPDLGEDPKSRSSNNGLQYSSGYGADYRTPQWIYFLDLSRRLSRGRSFWPQILNMAVSIYWGSFLTGFGVPLKG